jgi:hypothetical protein
MRQPDCYALSFCLNIDANDTSKASQITIRRATLTRFRPLSYFLNLLKRDAQFLAERGLTHVLCVPAFAHLSAGIGVDGARSCRAS